MKQFIAKIIIIASISITLQGGSPSDQSSADQRRTTNQSINESPNKGYGLRLLPALWSMATYNPYKAMLFGGASLCTAGYALYYGLRNKPFETAKIAATTLALCSSAWACQTSPDLYFLNLDDSMLTPENLIFPAGFLFATGGSAYQIEGCGQDNGGQDTSTYAADYRNKILSQFDLQNLQSKDKVEHSRITNVFHQTFMAPGGVGLACNEWNLYTQDADLKQRMGINADRFSIERFKVEPKPGIFNTLALQHYADKALTLIKRGI